MLIYFRDFLGFLQPSSSDDNKVICIGAASIESICTRDTYARDTYARDTSARDIFSAKGASIKGLCAVERLEIHLQIILNLGSEAI